MKKVVFIICVIAALHQSACQQKMICPAYHSYFILDVDETRNKFSLFGPDSLPKKNWEVDKKKYGIAREVSDAQKLKEMRVISMESVYKKIEDPMERFQRERMEAIASAADTTMMLDSAAVMARSRGEEDIKNIDQMIYLHHFGKYLPRRGGGIQDDLREDLKPEEKEQEVEQSEDQAKPEKKRKLWPFGKKKKNRQEADSEEEDAQEP